MEAVQVDVNNLNNDQKRIDRIVRAHDEEVANLKLTHFEDKGAGEWFLIYERTPQFHDWYKVVVTTDGDKTSYSLNKIPHMG